MPQINLMELAEQSFGTSLEQLDDRRIYKLLVKLVQERSAACPLNNGKKKLYYISAEFLIGKLLINNMIDLGIYDEVKDQLTAAGHDLNKIEEFEVEPSLGNGGLGRLAACYLDSMTTLEIPATGYSICYELGIFKQKIVEGQQVELPDNWKDLGAAWLMPKPAETQEVRFGGTVREFWDNGHLHIVNEDATVVQAVPCDMEIAGYGTEHVNVLRLWDARSTRPVDMALFSRGEYLKASEDEAMAETIAKVLYRRTTIWRASPCA